MSITVLSFILILLEVVSLTFHNKLMQIKDDSSYLPFIEKLSTNFKYLLLLEIITFCFLVVGFLLFNKYIFLSIFIIGFINQKELKYKFIISLLTIALLLFQIDIL